MCFCVSVSFSADGEIKHVFQIFINKKNVWYILYIFRICVLQLLIFIGGVSKTWHVRGPATWKDILREKERDKKSEYYLSYCENHPDEQYIGENKENKQHWKIKKKRWKQTQMQTKIIAPLDVYRCVACDRECVLQFDRFVYKYTINISHKIS